VSNSISDFNEFCGHFSASVELSRAWDQSVQAKPSVQTCVYKMTCYAQLVVNRRKHPLFSVYMLCQCDDMVLYIYGAYTLQLKELWKVSPWNVIRFLPMLVTSGMLTELNPICP